MLNLFKSKKDPGKSPAKSSRRGQTTTNRTGARTPNGDSKSWFSKPTRPVRINNNNIKVVQVRSLSSSSPALSDNNESKKSKRPLTIVGDANVTLRRGQQSSKIEAQTPEDLSRSSSITNLNVDQKAKGAKPKKSDSKDKLDKVVDKKHEKNRTLNKNNNKETGDSLTEIEPLQKQLAQMEKEKSNLALQLGEQTGHLNKLQNEVAHLKMMHEESNQKLEQLMDENTILRNRLRDVAHSPLSDNEKQQLLYESHRHHSSAPASIATNLLDDGGDVTPCHTPEWDKHSSSNVSDVSVACLQDKINQMQETHYSTNEELQATLQELTDLQRQLTELQQENVRINEEKNLMFESLCRQTERLNDSRNEVESLKQLLYKDENGQFETAAEREQKLVDLLKSAQEERESLLVKQEQLGNELEDSRSTNLILNNEIAQLTERVKTLESTLDAKHAEHKQLDQELAQAKDQSSGRQIEINRFKDLLENARTKINELEQDRTLSDKSELDELLDNARKEKDALESEVAHLKEQLALSKNETEKLKEQVSILQEECKVTRNNAKTTQSDLEYKLEKVIAEKNNLTDQLQHFQEVVNELQVQAQCQSDDKRQLSAVLSETQRNLNESERRIVDLENELVELKKTKQEQEEEWEKFQNDLLTSVRVANDFKTEAQQDLQKLIMENKAGRERIKQLETQIDKLKGGNKKKLTVSNEETLTATLNRRYKEIEAIPDSHLTEEEKAIKILKVHYDRDLPRQKPVAHKPKDKLAISKPSLESVISNPKLQKIVTDSQVKNVEALSYFSDDENRNRKLMSPTRMSLLDDIGPPVDEIDRKSSFPKSDTALYVAPDPSEEIQRSKSLTDLPTIAEDTQNLRRYESTDDLLSLSKEKKPRKKSTVNLNTLEKICNQINPNTPEDQLTKEQRLALRLRDVLNKEGRKATLKKKQKLTRKIVITRPTQESVESNSKLREIINDPFMKKVGSESKVLKRDKGKFKKSKERYSMPAASHIPRDSLTLPKKSKSYNDISFKFRVPNMYSEEDKSLVVAPVLPPEEFRDVSSPMLEDSTVFKDFPVNNNTFKKEHSYLDYDGDDEHRDFEFEESTDEDNLSREMEVSDFEERQSPLGQVSEDTTSQIEYDDRSQAVDMTDFEERCSPEEAEITETLSDIIIRRIEYEDSFKYDEEEIRERRGTRNRYSHVVAEIKDKFEHSSDENEDFLEDKPRSVDVTHHIVDSEKSLQFYATDEGSFRMKKEYSRIPEVKYTFYDKEESKTRYSDTSYQEWSKNLMENKRDWRSSAKDLTEEEFALVEEYSNRRPSRPLSEINPADLALVDGLREQYLDLDERNEETNRQRESDGLETNTDEWLEEPISKDTEKFTETDLETIDHYSKRQQTDIQPEDLEIVQEFREQYLDLVARNEHQNDKKKDIDDIQFSDTRNEWLKESISEHKYKDWTETEMFKGEDMELISHSHRRPLVTFKPEDLAPVDQYLDVVEKKEDPSRSQKPTQEQEFEKNLEGTPENFTKKDIELINHSRPLSDIKPEDLALVDGLREQYLDVDDKKEELNGKTEYLDKIEGYEKSEDQDLDKFTEEDLDLIRHYATRRFSRPISDIKPEDLALVHGLKQQYFDIADKKEVQIDNSPKEDTNSKPEYLDKNGEDCQKSTKDQDLEKFTEDLELIIHSNRPLSVTKLVDLTLSDGLNEHEDDKIEDTEEERALVNRHSQPLSDNKPKDLDHVDGLKEQHLDLSETKDLQLKQTDDSPHSLKNKIEKKKYSKEENLLENDIVFPEVYIIDHKAGVEEKEDTERSEPQQLLTYNDNLDDGLREDGRNDNKNTNHVEEKEETEPKEFTYHEADIEEKDAKGSELIHDLPQQLLISIEDLDGLPEDGKKENKNTDDLQQTPARDSSGIDLSPVERTEETKPRGHTYHEADIEEKKNTEGSELMHDLPQQLLINIEDLDGLGEDGEKENNKKSPVRDGRRIDPSPVERKEETTTRGRTYHEANVDANEPIYDLPQQLQEDLDGLQEDGRKKNKNTDDLQHQSPAGDGKRNDPSRERKKEMKPRGHTYPRILSPSKLYQPSTYEPVYENFYVASNRNSFTDSSVSSGKKPVALPRMISVDENEPIYRDFGGQVTKTRFSITYDRKKGDSFKERHQEKSAKVKDLREMFERKSKSDFSSLVSKALEDD